MGIAYKQLAVALQLSGLDLKSAKGNIDQFIAALSDDFNTSNALTALFDELKKANVELRKNPRDNQKLLEIFANIRDMLHIFGIQLPYPELSKEDIELYQQYLSLKKEKRFAESDVIRDQLIQKNIL